MHVLRMFKENHMPDRQIAPFLTAVDRLYAAALNPAEWQAFLAAAAALFDADNAYISQVEDDRRVLDCVALKHLNWDAAYFCRHTALSDEDSGMPPFRRGPPQPQQRRMAVAGARLHASSPCTAALKPPDVEYTLTVSMPERDGVTNYVGLTRAATRESFDASNREVLEGLVPHLDRAFAIRRGLLRKSIPSTVPGSDVPLDNAAGGCAGKIPHPVQVHVNASQESIIQSRFGLSPQQTVLTGLLLSGRSVKEAAVALGLTEGTARQYLKLIFSKTGARRQVDLIRVVAKALAPQS
jgi:DNA-binding CsgD family transcriptional regulator